MPTLRLMGFLLLGFVRTALRRLRHGPLRPSWSFAFEAFTRGLKAQAAFLAPRPYPEQRRYYEALARPHPLYKTFDFSPTTLGGVRAEWMAPKDLPADAPVLLYFHGGSYLYGSLDSHRELMVRLSRAARVRLVAVDYRLAPEHPFPAALDDALAVYRALVASGVSVSRLFVAGESAGGGLTLALLCALRDAGEALPVGALPLCPWVDLSAQGGSLESHAAFDWGEPRDFAQWSRDVLAGASATDPRASPTFARLEGLPPLFITVGGAEMLRDQVVAFVEKARAANVDVTFVEAPDMVHAWFLYASMFETCAEPYRVWGEWIAAKASA